MRTFSGGNGTTVPRLPLLKSYCRFMLEPVHREHGGSLTWASISTNQRVESPVICAQSSIARGAFPEGEVMAGGNMVLSGDPERCLIYAMTYQQADTEMLLCHMQTYKVTHQHVMDSISSSVSM